MALRISEKTRTSRANRKIDKERTEKDDPILLVTGCKSFQAQHKSKIS